MTGQVVELDEDFDLKPYIWELLIGVRADIFLVVNYYHVDCCCFHIFVRLRIIVKQYNSYNFLWLSNIFLYFFPIGADRLSHSIKLRHFGC